MKVVERHRSPLSRQVHEGVELELCKAGVVMNSKAEWNGSRLPRIIIEQGEDLTEDIEVGLNRGYNQTMARKRITTTVHGKRRNEDDVDSKRL